MSSMRAADHTCPQSEEGKVTSIGERKGRESGRLKAGAGRIHLNWSFQKKGKTGTFRL